MHRTIHSFPTRRSSDLHPWRSRYALPQPAPDPDPGAFAFAFPANAVAKGYPGASVFTAGVQERRWIPAFLAPQNAAFHGRSPCRRGDECSLLLRDDIALDLQLVRDLATRIFRHVARRKRAGAHAPQLAFGRLHAVDITVEALPAQTVAQLVGRRFVAECRQLHRPRTRSARGDRGRRRIARLVHRTRIDRHRYMLDVLESQSRGFGLGATAERPDA